MEENKAYSMETTVERYNSEEREIIAGLQRAIEAGDDAVINERAAHVFLNALKAMSDIRNMLVPLDGTGSTLMSRVHELVAADRDGRCAVKTKQQELTIMIGLPLSGKSSWAKAHSEKRGHVIVCPDTIRLALHGQQFVGLAEPFVWAIAQTMVRALLMSGHSVIVDATNTTRHRRKMWVDIAKERGVRMQGIWLNTPAEECHRRNALLGRLSPSVIDRMAAQFEMATPEELNCHQVPGCEN